MNDVLALQTHLAATLDTTVVGMADIRRLLGIAFIARGHVLLEGPPGLGKTLLARTFAAAVGGEFQRIQGTADLMPSDVTGQNIFDQRTAQFSFRRGPVFANVVLADEINRTGPKTQSALLEAMAERHVTVDRVRHALPPDFLVIATQNPHEFEGTYPLPESQLDRFMFTLSVPHPSQADELAVLRRYERQQPGRDEPPAPAATPVPALVAAARAQAAAVHVSDALLEYVVALVRATREHPAVSLGVSTRGLLSLVHASRAAAALSGADYVTPDDVKSLAVATLAHRLSLRPEAALEGRSNAAVIADVLDRTPVPR